MTTKFQSWQSVWESTIRRSSLNRRTNGISEKENVNMYADSWYKKFGYKFNVDDQQRQSLHEYYERQSSKRRIDNMEFSDDLCRFSAAKEIRLGM